MSTLRIIDAHVAHERLDDEVVVINLETGAYYALDGPSADYWTLLAGQTPVDAVIDLLAERHRADRDVVRADVGALAADLVREGLAVWDEEATGAPDPAALLPEAGDTTGSPTYVPLQFEKYDDMEELLLLDPIHEVDDAGWPALPAETV